MDVVDDPIPMVLDNEAADSEATKSDADADTEDEGVEHGGQAAAQQRWVLVQWLLMFLMPGRMLSCLPLWLVLTTTLACTGLGQTRQLPRHHLTVLQQLPWTRGMRASLPVSVRGWRRKLVLLRMLPGMRWTSCPT